MPILQNFYRHIYDREWHFACKDLLFLSFLELRWLSFYMAYILKSCLFIHRMKHCIILYWDYFRLFIFLYIAVWLHAAGSAIGQFVATGQLQVFGFLYLNLLQHVYVQLKAKKLQVWLQLNSVQVKLAYLCDKDLFIQ